MQKAMPLDERWRIPLHATESRAMPRDLQTILRLKSRSHSHDGIHCSSCHRVPLAGEILHELESHKVVCQLCLTRLPDAKRNTVGATRVHASERPLAVIARAA